MKLAAYLPLLAVTLALGACGGEDLSRQEFMARAEKTCRQSIPEFAQLRDPQTLSLPGLARFAEEAKKLTKKRQEQLQKATPPRDTAEEYGEFLVHLGDVEKRLEDLKEAARASDLQEVEHSLLETHQSGEKARNISERMGLEPCTQLAAGIAREADSGPSARGSLSSPARRGVALAVARSACPG